MSNSLKAYKAKQARVKAVWLAVSKSGLDVYAAFAHYTEALIAAQGLWGQSSPEFRQARLNLEAFVEPWLERAS